MAIDHAAERIAFEKAAYSTYFVNSIRKDVNARPFALVLPDGTVDKATFCALNDKGEYTIEGLQPAWIFWCKRAELDQSGGLFALIEDMERALAERMKLPEEERGEAALAELSATLSSFVAGVRAMQS